MYIDKTAAKKIKDTIKGGLNGLYRTKAGSTVRVSGRYNGIIKIDFDWFEEGGCIECESPEINIMDFPDRFGNFFLTWYCEYCSKGIKQARLYKVEG